MTGVIAPMSVNGVTTAGCPCSAIVIRPSVISASKRRGELTEMIVSTDGCVDDLLQVEAARERRHRDPVERALAPDRREWKTRSVYVRLARYVSRCARRGRKLLRRRRLVADEVDDVEALRELDEGDVVVEISRAPTANPVVHGRRAGDEAECDLVPAEVEPPRRVRAG